MKIRKQQANQGFRISTPSTNPEALDDEKHPPLFCLRYLQKDWCVSDCEKDDQAAFADRLRRLSQLTWEQLRAADRHGMGYEKIAQNGIRAPIPGFVTPDVGLIAFRFHGLKVVVGYRVRRIFHILWLDRAFSLYKH